VPTLITGATGFLGRHLVPLLAARGDALRALVREGTDASRLAAHEVEVVRGNVLDEAAVRRAAAGCERVYHLAGKVDHRRRLEAEIRAANVDGVRVVLEAADPDARFVHASSISAIGPAPGPGAASDETVPFPEFAERYVYHRSKRDGERLALQAAAEGRDVVVANIGFIIGPEDFERVTGWMVERYLQGLIRLVVEGGLSFFDVRDAARGLVLLEERGRAGERTILTNRAGNLSIREFYTRVGEVTGVRRRQLRVPVGVAVAAARLAPWVVHADEVEAVANWWFYDPAKAERELGLQARPIEETIADTAAQYLHRRLG
jgi:dihydroflavonol-4-reductase